MEESDLYLCQVCLENQSEKNPRLLPCHHSFCQGCLEKVMKDGTIKCPICQQVSPVPDNDITKLSMNFILIKAKEHFHRKRKQCQICYLNAADKKCSHCTHLLCEECIVSHQTIQAFRNHVILPVCPEHPEGVLNLVCLKCIKGVCSICVFKYHIKHKKHIVVLNEGIPKIKEKLDKIISKNKILLQEIKERKSRYQLKLEESETTESNIASMHQCLVAKCKKVKEYLDKMRCYNKTMRNKFVTYEKDETKLEKLRASFLKLLSEPDIMILRLYPSFQDKADSELNIDVNQLFEIDHDNPYTMEKLQSELDDFATIQMNVTARKPDVPVKSELILEYKNMGELFLKYPMRIQAVDSHIAAVFDISSSRYACIDMEGELLERPAFKYNYCDAVYNCNYIWYIHGQDISKYPYATGDREDYYTTNLEKMSRIFNGISPKMIIYENVNNSLYEYFNDKVTKVVTNIIVDHVAINTINGGQTGYIVTNTFDNILTLYDTEWKLQHTIDGDSRQITCPSECISTPMGLLVANTCNNCITLLDHQGELIDACVLGEADGIRRPVSIDYMEPYLWIAECDRSEGHRSIKCFEIKIKR